MTKFARNKEGDLIRYHVKISGPDHRVTETFPRNPYQLGYGAMIPTCHMVWITALGNYWRRVYVMLYSNSGTAYVKAHGKRYIVDLDN